MRKKFRQMLACGICVSMLFENGVYAAGDDATVPSQEGEVTQPEETGVWVADNGCWRYPYLDLIISRSIAARTV